MNTSRENRATFMHIAQTHGWDYPSDLDTTTSVNGMLILDLPTRWTSTLAMVEQAIICYDVSPVTLIRWPGSLDSNTLLATDITNSVRVANVQSI